MNYFGNISLRIPILFLFTLIFFSCEKSEVGDTTLYETYVVASPKLNETVLAGILFKVEWYAPSFSYVDIELYKGADFVYTIVENTDASSEYDWMSPDDLTEGSDYYIKVINSDNKDQSIISKYPFTVKSHQKEFSTFTDPLDGRVYKTTKIGDQWWMAENYSYDSEHSFWFEKDKQQYESYGKMYTFENAIECAPPGWHLPSNSEWEELNNYLGSSVVVGLQVGGGSGFDAAPRGFYVFSFGAPFFAHASRETRYWTSTIDDYFPVIRILSWASNDLIYYTGGDVYTNDVRTYVRYVKDKN